MIGEFISVEPCLSYYLGSRVAHPRTHLHYLWVEGVEIEYQNDSARLASMISALKIPAFR